MDGEALHRQAHAAAAALPGAGLEYPFGPEHEVYKVRGKVFLLATVLRDTPIVTLKADPEDARLLVQTYPDITPGYHMNKRHWVTLRPGPSLTEELVRSLVADSYSAVVARLPLARRPLGYQVALGPGDRGPDLSLGLKSDMPAGGGDPRL